jgi:hypothetical protein
MDKLKEKIILELVRALWGRITPQIRAVSFTVTEKEIVIFVYTDGEVSEEEKDDLDIIGSEVIAGIIVHRFIDVRIISINFPETIPVEGELVFLRKESKVA